jgi:hypothetical protein
VVGPLVALVLDLLMNRLVMSQKHLAINLLLLIIYFFLFAVVGSAIQKFRPVYGPHLSYFDYDNKAMNFTPTVPVISDLMKLRVQQCQVTLGFQPDAPNIPYEYRADWTKTGITLASCFAVLIVSHCLITFLQNKKSQKFFEGDADRNASMQSRLMSEDKAQ